MGLDIYAYSPEETEEERKKREAHDLSGWFGDLGSSLWNTIAGPGEQPQKDLYPSTGGSPGSLGEPVTTDPSSPGSSSSLSAPWSFGGLFSGAPGFNKPSEWGFSPTKQAVPQPDTKKPRDIPTPAPNPSQSPYYPTVTPPGQGATATPQGTLAALDDYYKKAQKFFPDQPGTQNPLFAKAQQLAEKTKPTKADMLAALGFGVAAAPTADPWRALGIGGTAALAYKQGGYDRYMNAITDLSKQQDVTNRADLEMTRGDRVATMNTALQMHQDDQKEKYGYGRSNAPGKTQLEQIQDIQSTYQRLRADLDKPGAVDQNGMPLSDDGVKAEKAKLDKKEKDEISYLVNGFRSTPGGNVADSANT